MVQEDDVCVQCQPQLWVSLDNVAALTSGSITWFSSTAVNYHTRNKVLIPIKQTNNLILFTILLSAVPDIRRVILSLCVFFLSIILPTYGNLGILLVSLSWKHPGHYRPPDPNSGSSICIYPIGKSTMCIHYKRVTYQSSDGMSWNSKLSPTSNSLAAAS